MLTEENIEVMNDELEAMEEMNIHDSIDLYLQKIARDRLLDLGFTREQAVLGATSVSSEIDFDPSDEDEVSLTHKYIQAVVDLFIRQAFAICDFDDERLSNDIALQCFINIAKHKPITMN